MKQGFLHGTYRVRQKYENLLKFSLFDPYMAKIENKS